MAAGDPTGDDLCVGTTDADTLPNFGVDTEDREITFVSGVELTEGVKYAIVVRALTAANFDSVYWTMGGDDLADNTAKYSNDSGESWSDDSGDMWFQTKALGVAKDSNAGTGGTGYDIYNIKWNGQTFTASSTYTITSVILRLAKWGGSSPGTLTVSIKATSSGLPTKATNPTPVDTANSVTLDQATITWEDGGGADTYDVYYGDTSGALGDAVSSAQAGTSFTITGATLGSPFSYLNTRYWRIDSTNDEGTTTGDEWSFITIWFVPPGVTYYDSITGQRYKLLVDADGDYGDHPDGGEGTGGGVEDTDFEYLAATYAPNFMRTMRKLVGAANDKLWIEDL